MYEILRDHESLEISCFHFLIRYKVVRHSTHVLLKSGGIPSGTKTSYFERTNNANDTLPTENL
jgi:hypothetical protein